MKKTLILALFIALAVGLNVNYISAQETSVEGIATAISAPEITSSDLGVENPGILPTSPFYFLKNWGRTIKRTITINPVKKANLELEIANQQAAEINRIKEISPEKINSISRAVENYQSNVERLKTRLEELKETSKNPNVDTLLEKLADRSVKHQQLFDELKKKFENQDELKNKLESAQEQINEAVLKISEKFDTPEVFKERLQRVIGNRPDGIFKELRGVEIIDRIGEKMPEDRRAQLQGIKDDLIKKFEGKIEGLNEKDKERILSSEIFNKLPGDSVRRLRIFEEFKDGIESPKIEERLMRLKSEILKENIDNKEINKDVVEKLMTEVKNFIVKAENGLINIVNQELALRVKKAIENSKYHLSLAEKTLSEEKIGEAFGHATAAGAAVKNALKILVAPIQGQISPTSVMPVVKEGVISTSIREQIICTQEYRPVCGVNNQTYSNPCRAKVANVVVAHQGICSGAQKEAIEEFQDIR